MPHSKQQHNCIEFFECLHDLKLPARAHKSSKCLQMLAAAVKGVGGGLHSRAGDLWGLLLRPDLLKLSDFRGAAVSLLLVYAFA
jgi:hypothetical protein